MPPMESRNRRVRRVRRGHQRRFATEARVQNAQREIEGIGAPKRPTRLATLTEIKIKAVATNFHDHAIALLQAIEDIDPNWGVEKGYTKEYWLSDIEMVPHLATVSLAVKVADRQSLLVGPAVELYGMYNTHPGLKEKFVACFDDLEDMKKIPNDGLHDDVFGLSRTPINWESILHEAVGQGRWPLVQTQ